MTSEEYFLNYKRKIIECLKNNIKSIDFIGIDPSLQSTGIAVVNNNKYIAGDEIKSKTYGYDRWAYLIKNIFNFINQYNNPFIILEGYAYAAQGRSIISLSEFGGILRFILTMKNIKFLEISPQSLKKYVIGSGQSDKNLMPLFINKKFGITAIGGDHADAVGLAMLGYHAYKYLINPDEKYTLIEKEVFDTFLSLEKKAKKKKKITTQQLSLDINE